MPRTSLSILFASLAPLQTYSKPQSIALDYRERRSQLKDKDWDKWVESRTTVHEWDVDYSALYNTILGVTCTVHAQVLLG